MCEHFALPGIKSIEYINANRLPSNIVLQALAGIEPYIYLERTPIVFSSKPTVEVERQNTDNGSQETATLSFRSRTLLPEEYPLAFIITDAENNHYLMGLREKPYASITIKQTFGNPSEDANTASVDVKFSSLRALMPCKLPD